MEHQNQKVLFADTRVDADVKDILRHAVREFNGTCLVRQTNKGNGDRVRESSGGYSTRDESSRGGYAERREIIATQRSEESGSSQR